MPRRSFQVKTLEKHLLECVNYILILKYTGLLALCYCISFNSLIYVSMVLHSWGIAPLHPFTLLSCQKVLFSFARDSVCYSVNTAWLKTLYWQRAECHHVRNSLTLHAVQGAFYCRIMLCDQNNYRNPSSLTGWSTRRWYFPWGRGKWGEPTT